MDNKLSSDTVSLEVKRLEHCKVEFHAKAHKILVEKAYNKALKEVGKNVSVPGFRKGKAPEAMIVSKFKKQLDDRWNKDLADLTFQESEKLANIPPVTREARIGFEMKSLTTEEATMVFTFETEPEVPTIDPKSLGLESIKRDTVDDAKIDETIHQIRLFFATFEPVTDRPAKEGDFVRIDVDIIEEEPPVNAIKDSRFEVSKEHMAQWMMELVVGANIGDAKDGISKPDDDLSEEEKKAAGEPKKVRLTLAAIEEAKLPETDDALATKLGAKDLVDMRVKLEGLLNKRADEDLANKERDLMANALIKECPFDLPQTMIDREAHYRLQQLSQDKDFQQKFMALDEEQRKTEIEQIKEQGARAVRLFYLCRKVVDDAKLEINPDEIESQASTPLEAMFMPNRPPESENQEQKALAISRLMLTKAQDYLIAASRK